jgi:L-lactate utilization protein LutC
MTDARDEMLRKLRLQARGNEPPPPVWESRRRFDDLAARFCESLNALKGEAFRAESLDAALDKLGDVFQSLNAKRIVANAEPPISGLDLTARWPGIDWHIVGKSDGDLRAFCAAADVGLSGADAALAETGSVVISSGPGRSRLATLLPTAHIALVPLSRLTADIFTWTAARQGAMPANTTIITGPSKSADIEQTTAFGMHGPKRMIAILYGD